MNIFSIEVIVNEMITFLSVQEVITKRYLSRTFNRIAVDIYNKDVKTFIKVYNDTCEEIYNKLMNYHRDSKSFKNNYPTRKNCIFLNRLLFFYEPMLQKDIVVEKMYGYNVLVDLAWKYNWYIDEKTVLLGIHLHQNMNFKSEKDGQTALVQVAYNGTKKMFRKIVEKGGDIHYRTKRPKRDLLDWSFVNNNIQMQIELFLHTSGLKKIEYMIRILCKK